MSQTDEPTEPNQDYQVTVDDSEPQPVPQPTPETTTLTIEAAFNQFAQAIASLHQRTQALERLHAKALSKLK